MTTIAQTSLDTHSSPSTISVRRPQGNADGNIDMRQDYLDKLFELKMLEAEVDALSTELVSVDADILEGGSNAEKLHHSRILGTNLVAAQRQVCLARQSFQVAAARLGDFRPHGQQTQTHRSAN